MSTGRAVARINGLASEVRAGIPMISPRIINTVTADAAYTLTTGNVASGLLQFTGLTAGRNLTITAAADLDAAFPEVEVGESLDVQISITTAFALTYVAGAGITLAGAATIPASSSRHLFLTKTGTGAWTATGF